MVKITKPVSNPETVAKVKPGKKTTLKMKLPKSPKKTAVKTSKRKIIIDTDMCQDDAVAYLLCLQQPNVEVLAVTTVSGNHHVTQVLENVATINLNMRRKNKVPVYPGSSQGMLEKLTKSRCWVGHGLDGIGDSTLLKRKNLTKHEKKHAVFALIDLIKENPHEVELLMIGPLTNLAMAIRMEPDLPSLIKRVSIMGGTTTGHGNATMPSEFNFSCDPEAAHVVFQAFETDKNPKILLFPWDSCLKHTMNWTFYDQLCGRGKTHLTQAGRVLKEATGAMEKYCRKLSHVRHNFTPCDAYAAAVLLDQNLITEGKNFYVDTEISGTLCRGATIIDWYSHKHQTKTAKVVLAIDQDAFEATLYKAFCQ